MEAGRLGRAADEPEPQIAAIALIELWRVQAAGLGRRLTGTHPPTEVRTLVTADVARAAEVIRPALDRLGEPI